MVRNISEYMKIQIVEEAIIGTEHCEKYMLCRSI